jgi:metal-dependent hydrolase (beta-lactamase superfamily II)
LPEKARERSISATHDGCAGNLCRLGQDPVGIEAIVCSHGYFDHTTGLSGLIGRLGRARMRVLIHHLVGALEHLAHEMAVPTHCTGWKATRAIARRLPAAFIQNNVGTTFHPTAAAT